MDKNVEYDYPEASASGFNYQQLQASHALIETTTWVLYAEQYPPVRSELPMREWKKKKKNAHKKQKWFMHGRWAKSIFKWDGDQH